MSRLEDHIRVLYSFPHKLGADRICYTAWEQVNGAADAGVQVLAMPGVLHRPVHPSVGVQPTLAFGKLRISYKIVGTLRACWLHDQIVARRLAKMKNEVDIVHVWPLGALETIKTANRYGIPTVLERPNAHTRFAYEVVRDECNRLGVQLPPGHEHAFNEEILRREEEEYRLAWRLLCPSEFTAKTFLDKGHVSGQLVRHQYGYDEKTYYPSVKEHEPDRGLRALFVGVCAVRKGLHFALEAWLNSPAHRTGTFSIAGEFVSDYQAKLTPMLSHPSVRVLGHRNDVPELMRNSDILLLPTIEEGFGLVCVEAIGSGCVPLVSEACTDMCRHMENSLVHRIGDTAAITQHITLLHENPALLAELRDAGLRDCSQMTWTAAGKKLAQVYRNVIADFPVNTVTACRECTSSSQA